MGAWRNSASIAGYRSQVRAAINASDDGAYAVIDLKTAEAITEICEQAEKFERNCETT